MLMLKKGMMLVGLIFFSLPANAGCTLEETARKVIMGFQQEDAQLINSLIDKKRVCMFFSTVVLRWMLKILSKLISGNLFPSISHGPRQGNMFREMTNLIRKLSRNLTANVAGISRGILLAIAMFTIKSAVVWSSRRCLVHRKILFLMRRLPQRVEWNTGPCVWSLRQKRVTMDWYFYLSQLYSYDSDWYLTVVDQIGDCGA